MRPQEKIMFTLAFVAMGWMLLLFMPRLPQESPASGVEIFIYAVVNFYAMFRVNRWFKEINR
jgi:predicted membrane channel-forming protein YqfA (hemolysin III family)